MFFEVVTRRRDYDWWIDYYFVLSFFLVKRKRRWIIFLDPHFLSITLFSSFFSYQKVVQIKWQVFY